MLLRILTFFKWVYGNPLTFLVGIWRIPAYHVDYTTAISYMTVAESAFALSARRYFAFSSGESSSQCHILFLVKYRFVSFNL